MNWKWADQYTTQFKKSLEEDPNQQQDEILVGYYNHNIVVSKDNQKFLLRIPIKNADSMDFRLVPEVEVLQFLEEQDFPAPRLLYRGREDKFFIHNFIEGEVFNNIYPASTPFPDWVPRNIALQMKNLHRTDPSRFSKYTGKIAKSPNSSQFYMAFLKFVQNLFDELYPNYHSYYSQLMIPKDPLKIPRELADSITDRDFVFCHCDVHRKNLIILPNKEDLVFLDWELTLVTDPLYDIAVHFHKMRYETHQEVLFVEKYLDCNKRTDAFQDTWDQIQIYLKLERIKSAIIDFYRYHKDVKTGRVDGVGAKFYSEHYYPKLLKAWKVWGVDSVNITPRFIEELLHSDVKLKEKI